jgi:site-specific DNA-adenine methylase
MKEILLIDKLNTECRVMLSNSNTPLIMELYAKPAEDIREVNAIRAINCKGLGTIGHTELIIRNYS